MTAAADGTAAVTITSTDPVRVYVARDRAARMEPQFIGPVVGPLFDRLAGLLRGAGLTPDLPAVAWYLPLAGAQGGVEVNASFVAPDDAPLGPVPGQGFEVVQLPALERAAVLVHHGPPDTLGRAYLTLFDQLSRAGWTVSGPCREVYLSPDSVPQEEWVTELHVPVTRAG